MKLTICHLYPDVLSLYGDGGNILCLTRRLAWRGIDFELTGLPIGQTADFSAFDLFFIGGGQDFEQQVLLEDLRRGKADEIKAAAADGKTFLAVCGGYQMLGQYYKTHDGEQCDFIGALDLYTQGEKDRMIGDFAFDTGGECADVVVGFENHSGRTYLGEGVSPLGKVLRGFGNNGKDGTEGARYNNIFATYSHGPVLPKNPRLADEILKTALTQKYPGAELSPLDDTFEQNAHDYIRNRLNL